VKLRHITQTTLNGSHFSGRYVQSYLGQAVRPSLFDAFLRPDIVRVFGELFDKVLALLVQRNSTQVQRLRTVTIRLRETAT